MSDTETHAAEPNAEQEPPPESTDIASSFALFKDYFDKKLNVLKRDIQEDSFNNTDSIAKKPKEESKITFKFEGMSGLSNSRKRF